MKAVVTTLCLLGASLWLCRAAKPLGGKFSGPAGIKQTLYWPKDATGEEPTESCRALSLYKDATITLRMKASGRVDVTVLVSIIKSKCANFRTCDYVTESSFISGYMRNVSSYVFSDKIDTKPEILIGKPPASPPTTEEDKGETEENKGGKGKNTERSEDQKSVASSSSVVVTPTPGPTKPSDTSTTTSTVQKPSTDRYRTNESGLFIVYIQTWIRDKDKHVNLTFDLEMKNKYGYLSAIDYPALVFYGLMLAVYIILGLAWAIMMCCSYKDLVRLQFWVFAVIILGFLEKVFFVSEYSSINQGEQASLLILLAEAISAVKRALARVLLLIVCYGFGTVKPRLGDQLMKVVAMGVIYCILALIDGIVRSRSDTFDTGDKTQMVTLALLFIMDSIIFYWAIISLVEVRRALRLRKNYVKLAMYNHFAYTLIFSLLATLAFTIWVFVEVNFPKDSCLEDWQEVWLRDCFWHFLFCVILVVIMIIWRPSANKNRFAYSLVNDLDQDDEEDEGMENKNFETVKMRTVSRGDAGTPPPISSTQAEDDLRWVEENLPTTAMDKALPLILDSDEEVMSTKFEVSKMN